ncbi:unnamed protein product [Rotaria sp. Silwood1]|nr:unnamed protein product [Rotaria sp. Silwood1]CAF3373989.1 unnamed protein product [Rotaria sp. Silwood1]CAF4490829.1 unnamed protein product [Rotaria sp. Silwood1]
MTSSSKRAATKQEQQSVTENDEYDDYVYYPYYPKSLPNGGYEYVQDPQKSEEYEQPSAQYYDEHEPNHSAPAQRQRTKNKRKMPKSPIETYSIEGHPLYSSSSNIPHIEIPSNNNIKIIITEPSPSELDIPERIHVIETNPTKNATLTRTKTSNTIPTIKIVEIPSSNNNNISRDIQRDSSNSSLANWTIIEKSLSTNDSIYRNEATDSIVPEKDRVRVIVRIRPLNERELENEKEPQSVLRCESENSIIAEGGQHSRRFFFDNVFDEGSTQEEVFHYSGIKRLVDLAIEGYVATCFAYGQTGSGKTHTMVGPGGAAIFRMDENYRAKNFGIAPRAINYLFQRLREKAQETNIPYYIRVAYCEIYNEQIRDLIRPENPDNLQVRGSIEDGFYVENLYQTYIETIDELLTILEEGELNRAMASHHLNDMSSRSHAMLSIQIEQDLQEYEDSQEQMTRQGKLTFVDLAGSEKVKVSHSKGKQLVETNNINKSLLTLGTCISALSDPTKLNGHVPYRESKLTRLLADSLGGHGITLMIACVSPSILCENESLSTLRYANRAKNIENVPLIKTDSKENVINRLKLEVRKLKDENHELRQKLGVQTNTNLPRIKNRNHDLGSQTSIRSSGSSDAFERQDTHGRLNGMTTQKIRSHHETLTRENEKLARQLHQRDRQQQGQSNGKRVIVVEDDHPVQRLSPPTNRRIIRTYANEPDDEILELVRRPSYTTRYRTVRNRYSDEGSPQRRTTTIVRRAPETIISEGNHII